MSTSRQILLIEPDDAIRQTLADVLTQAGHHVTAVAQAPDDYSAYDVVLGTANTSPIPVIPVTKPIRLGPLLLKINALSDARRPVTIGPWRFDSAARMVEDADGIRIRLTDKETAILDYLLDQDGPVGREQLLAHVWGYSSAISTHTLETHIYRLRQKIEPDPAQATLLVTEAGGYSLRLLDQHRS